MGHDSSHATLSNHGGHNIMLTPDSCLIRHKNLDGGIPKLYHAICDGPYAIVNDVTKFGFRALLPELYQEYCGCPTIYSLLPFGKFQGMAYLGLVIL